MDTHLVGFWKIFLHMTVGSANRSETPSRHHCRDRDCNAKGQLIARAVQVAPLTEMTSAISNPNAMMALSRLPASFS